MTELGLNKYFVRSMAEKGVYLTPTLSCYGRSAHRTCRRGARRLTNCHRRLTGIMQRAPWEDFLPPSGQVKNRQVMKRGLEALKLAEEEGVTIC